MITLFIAFLLSHRVSKKNTQQALALLEKDSIQPRVPLWLPCYDLTPVTRFILRFSQNLAYKVLSDQAVNPLTHTDPKARSHLGVE